MNLVFISPPFSHHKHTACLSWWRTMSETGYQNGAVYKGSISDLLSFPMRKCEGTLFGLDDVVPHNLVCHHSELSLTGNQAPLAIYRYGLEWTMCKPVCLYYLRIILNLLQDIERSAFMARAWSAGITTGRFTFARSSSRWSFVNDCSQLDSWVTSTRDISELTDAVRLSLERFLTHCWTRCTASAYWHQSEWLFIQVLPYFF